MKCIVSFAMTELYLNLGSKKYERTSWSFKEKTLLKFIYFFCLGKAWREKMDVYRTLARKRKQNNLI